MKIQNLVVLVAALALVSCAHEEKSQTVAPDKGAFAGELVDANGQAAPKWVTNPGQYKLEGGAKAVCGEGSMKGTRNISLAQSDADGRARTAIARALEVKVKSMLKDYQATTTGGAEFGKSANDEQHIEDVSKQITNQTINGSEPMETWISSQSTLHRLVCIDVEKFKGIINGMGQLSEAVRKAVVQRADKAFAELDAATAPQ
jgi:hypothetical protein